jgi:hypothetical protein
MGLRRKPPQLNNFLTRSNHVNNFNAYKIPRGKRRSSTLGTLAARRFIRGSLMKLACYDVKFPKFLNKGKKSHLPELTKRLI